ncbi:MAG: hypothetical protein IPM69_03260 [Ignavibacteria bacterium]|nr:hypothetical protein [Ignavibacteria bacterium]
MLLVQYVTLPAFSQIEPSDSSTITVGLKVSNISGYGFYCTKKITQNVSIQAMGLMYYYYNRDKNDIHKIYNYDIGLEIQRTIYRIPDFRIFILAGSYYYYDNDNNVENSNSFLKVNNSFNIGIGLSLEYTFKRLVISVDLGYKFFEDRIKVTENEQTPYPELHRVTKIGSGFGIGFRL